jgi:hypothetical protein
MKGWMVELFAGLLGEGVEEWTALRPLSHEATMAAPPEWHHHIST